MKTRPFNRFGMFAESVPLPSNPKIAIACNGPLTIQPAEERVMQASGVGKGRLTQEDERVAFDGHGPLSVKMPADAALTLQVRGPVKIGEMPELRVHARSVIGPVIIETLHTLQIDSVKGPLNATRIQGDVTGASVQGPITLEQVQGDVRIAKAAGPITVKKLMGDLELNLRGDAFIAPAGLKAQTLRIRGQDNVYLTLPASARVQGRIQAGQGVRVELDQLAASGDETNVTLTPAAGEGPIITLDIEVQGEAYVGPNPPAAPGPAYQKTVGRGWLARIFESLGRGESPIPSSAQASESAPAATPSTEDLSQEKSMILRMVAEGKITAEEGDQLLEALTQ